MTTLSLTEIIMIVPFFVMMGSVMTNMLMTYTETPLVQAFVNATSVILKNTEVVWRPAVNLMLMLLGPFKGVLVATLRGVFKGLVLAVLHLVSFVQTLVNATSSFALATKEFALSLTTVVKALTNLFVSTVHGVSYVIQSFQDVNLFLYRALFESHTVSWDDLYNISVPFVVVLTVLGYLTYRANRSLRTEVKKIEEEPFVPRRSSRIAKKRAMLLSADLAPLAPACKKTSFSTSNL